MNKLKLTLMALAAAAATMTGCAIFKSRTAGAIAESAVQIGTAKHLRAHPGDRAIFEATVIGLEGLIASTNYDAVAFADVLQRLPIDEFNGPDGDVYVSTVVAVWSAAVQDAVSINTPELVAPMVNTLLRGFKRGIASSTRVGNEAKQFRPHPDPLPQGEGMLSLASR
jgi:hypothetical protein